MNRDAVGGLLHQAARRGEHRQGPRRRASCTSTRVATNAARGVIQPLDDVAKALELKRGGLRRRRSGRPASTTASGTRIPLDVHPLGFFYNKTVMDQGRSRPGEAADHRRRVRRRAGRPEGQGDPGPLGHAVPVHRRTERAGPALAVRRQPVQRGRRPRRVWPRSRACKALTWFTDLVKNGHSPKNVAQDADIIALRTARTPSTGTASGPSTRSRRRRAWSGASPRCRTSAAPRPPGPARTSSCCPS